MRKLVLLGIFLNSVTLAQVMRGKVVMTDGSPPLQRVFIERVCPAGAPLQEALSSKQGEYFWRVPSDGLGMRLNGVTAAVPCVLRARIKDLVSQDVDIQDPKVLSNLQLPTLVLRRAGSEAEPVKLPRTALKSWELAVKAYQGERPAEAERGAREVARAEPKFAPAWTLIGLACNTLKKPEDAREAFQRAVAADPAALQPRVNLARVEIALKLWKEASRTTEALIQADTAHRYAEAYLDRGIAQYMLNDFEGARSSWRTYVERAPSASNAAVVQAKLDELACPAAVPVSEALPLALLAPADEPEYTPGGEAWVPGGRKALAAMARLKGTPAIADFFLEYSRAVATQTSRMTERPIPGYAAALRAYITSVAELMELGERSAGRTVLTLSLADERTPRILGLLGWKVVHGNGAATIEPGEQAADGLRQQIPRALGVDEISMQAELEAGRTFRLEILSENAPLTGGAAWGALLQSFATLPGGIAEAFARDNRLARVYAGLGAMRPEIAAMVVKHLGLRALTTADADALWLYGPAFREADVPGGPDAEAVWTRLAGASPRDPARFLEALLKVDRGRLAAYYAALAGADATRQKFFLKDVARAQRFYAWYRDSEELHGGIGVVANGWPTRFVQSIPLDDAGRVRFPGGRAAWSAHAASSDDDILWAGNARMVSAPPPVNFEILASVAGLERDRGAPLDAESASLLARNFGEWRALFPYFAALRQLGAPEFQALDAFTRAAAAKGPAEQELTMGLWHSVAALIVLGRKATSLDDAAAAHAFGRLCAATDSVAVLREIVRGGANLDDAVASSLLRLSGPRRAAFDRVRELQHAPGLATLSPSSDAATVVAALSGAVYAAMLDPDTLLVAEDRGLLRKHTFAPRRAALFAPASLAGSHLAGGFMNLEDVARGLARAGGGHPVDATQLAGGLGAATPLDVAPETVFRASARLVEVHTTVTDQRGRYVDGLRPEQFMILDDGRRQGLAAFENGAAALSCVLLLDTSQSMETALPALKSAARRLIAGLRPDDAVAVYSLNGGISELQPFTRDKTAAARAVLRAEIGELTALYDGLVRVNRDLDARTGKKVIVVFTDGEDTASALRAETAIVRAKTAGVPIYTIAQGHAVAHAALLQELAGMSQATGGLSFTIRSAAEIGPVFANVLQDLLHGYLLAFSPAGGEDREWRTIEVRAPGKVRAREGYYPE